MTINSRHVMPSRVPSGRFGMSRRHSKNNLNSRARSSPFTHKKINKKSTSANDGSSRSNGRRILCSASQISQRISRTEFFVMANFSYFLIFLLLFPFYTNIDQSTGDIIVMQFHLQRAFWGFSHQILE